jgi:hypothetical protein
MLLVLCNSDHSQIALQIADPSSRQRGGPKDEEQNNCLAKERKKKNLAMGPKRGARLQDI